MSGEYDRCQGGVAEVRGVRQMAGSGAGVRGVRQISGERDGKSTRVKSSYTANSYAVASSTYKRSALYGKPRHERR